MSRFYRSFYLKFSNEATDAQCCSDLSTDTRLREDRITLAQQRELVNFLTNSYCFDRPLLIQI